jgi:thiol-disulfide isomerase/thioredoxin
MIKKILLTAIVAVNSILFGQGIKFEEAKFSEILAKAKQENKLVFVDGYTSWCAPCKLMVKKIFPLQTVGDYYNSNFINTKFDMEKGEGVVIAKKYKISSYPSYLFLDGDGNVVHSAGAYMEEPEFIQFGKDALDPTKQIAALKKRFEKGEKDPEFLKKLAELSNDEVLTQKVLERYYTVNPNITKREITNLALNISGIEDPLYQLFKNKKSVFLKTISEKEYEELNKNIKTREIYKKAYNKASNTLDEEYYLTEMQKVVGKENAEEMLLGLKSNIALEKKDYESYEKLTLERFKDISNVDPGELSMTAYNVAESGITNKTFLEKTIQWGLESNNKMPFPMTMFALAKLYNKTGDKDNAKAWSQKAIEAAKSSKRQNPDFIVEIQEFSDKLK